MLAHAVVSFRDGDGAAAAAGIAYYALFSLFPLLLVLVASGSFLLDREAVMTRAVDLVSEALPVSQELIRENLQQVLDLRGAVGVAGLVAALWSATGVFTILSRNVNRAWETSEPRGYVTNRLLGLAMVVVLMLLLALSFVTTTVLNLLTQLRLPVVGGVTEWGLQALADASGVVPFLFFFVLFTALYRWVPNTDVPARAALGGGVVAAVAWQIAANAFSWFVDSGIARYRLVYGSLGAIVALLFWIYVSGWIILFGAHLSAAIGRRR